MQIRVLPDFGCNLRERTGSGSELREKTGSGSHLIKHRIRPLKKKPRTRPAPPPLQLGKGLKVKMQLTSRFCFWSSSALFRRFSLKIAAMSTYLFFVFFVFTLFQFQSLYTPYKIACHLPYNDFLCYILRHFSMIFNSKYMNCLRKNITSQN